MVGKSSSAVIHVGACLLSPCLEHDLLHRIRSTGHPLRVPHNNLHNPLARAYGGVKRNFIE